MITHKAVTELVMIFSFNEKKILPRSTKTYSLVYILLCKVAIYY